MPTTSLVSTTTGFAPSDPWVKIRYDEWVKRVAWAKEATEYGIYGSYDDMCDAISFGIAHTNKTTTVWNVSPDKDPYAYYTPLKKTFWPGRRPEKDPGTDVGALVRCIPVEHDVTT